ncbi:MAG: LamG-like jellyroll fold domain-containing protein [Phycisphaeraceae bacterium]
MTILKHIDFEVPDWGELAQGPQTRLAYRDEVMADNPIRYWRLGEPSGITAVDETGNGNGQYKNNPTLGAAGLLTLDPDTAVQFGSFSVMDSGTVLVKTDDGGAQAYTFECWFKSSASSNTSLMGQFKANDGNRWLLRLTTGGAIQYRLGGTAMLLAPGPFNDGVSHHLAVIKAFGLISMWIDGVFKTDTDNLHVFSDANFVVGATRTAGTGSFDGVIDEAAVYESFLSSSRITAHFDVGTAAV